MILKYKRSKISHAVLGVFLVALLAAFGLTRAQETHQSTPRERVNDTEPLANTSGSDAVALESLQKHDDATKLKAAQEPGTERSVTPGSLDDKEGMKPWADYVIEPPDVLSVKAVHLVPKPPGKQNDTKQIAGEHLVGPDGYISLGSYGRVYVHGLTVKECKDAIEFHLSNALEKPQVAVSVFSYNSKEYFIIVRASDKKAGEQVIAFPCTGTDTVMKAISNMNGLPPNAVFDIQHVRPIANAAHPQTTPLQWSKVIHDKAGFGDNLQLLPGDRIILELKNVKEPETNQSMKRKQVNENIGVIAHGRVLDPNGKPVEGALLVWQTEPNDYWDNREKAVKTDRNGYYRSPELKGMDGTITVIAEGFAPDMKKVRFEADMEAVDFSLKKGKTLEIRFVDKEGKPLPGVGLNMGGNPDPWWRPDSNIYTGYDKQVQSGKLPDSKIPSKADENGVYRWTWAPEDKVRFDFSKDGFLRTFTHAYTSEPSDWLVAGEKAYKITMYPKIVVSGTVVDDATGEPIPEFKTVPGNILKNYYPGGIIWQTGQGDDFKDGKFEHSFLFVNPDGYRLKIDAAGYASFISSDIPLGTTKMNLDIRLKKIAGLSGTVLLHGGSPAVGTKIYIVGDGRYMQVSNPPDSELLRGRAARLTVVADQAGKFNIFLRPDDKFGIYLEHPKGINWVKRDDFLKNSEIRLRGFGSGEVVLPNWTAGMKDARVWMNHSELGRDGFGHVDYQAEIKPGMKNVVFENLAAGKYEFSISASSPSHMWVRGSMGRQIISLPVEIKENETKNIDLNRPGAVVTGKVVLPPTVKEPFTERDWSYNYVKLASIGGDDTSRQQRLVYMNASKDEPQSGIFRFEQIPPGKYDVNITIFKAPADSTTMDAGFSSPLYTFSGMVEVQEGQKAVEIPLRQVFYLGPDGVMVFDRGVWKDEKTGTELPAPAFIIGTLGSFRLEKEGEIGKVVIEAGKGASGQGKYIKFSDGGNAIETSVLDSEDKNKLVIMGEKDVFLFENNRWKDEKTGKTFEPGTLVQGTRGLFRLERTEDGKGKIVLITGAGAVGEGTAIRWSIGGNGFSGGKAQENASE